MYFGEVIAENLNRNVLRDHIDYVEKGIRVSDDDYKRAILNNDKLNDFETFIKWKYDVDGYEVESKSKTNISNTIETFEASTKMIKVTKELTILELLGKKIAELMIKNLKSAK